MQVGLNLLGNSGGGGDSMVSKVEETETELELGLGLSLGGGGGGKGKEIAWSGGGSDQCGRILTAQDFPCVVSQTHQPNDNNSVAVSGTKRAADDCSGSPTAVSGQVVGWPPIRAYRINSLVNQAKAPQGEDKSGSVDENTKDVSKKKICNGSKTKAYGSKKGHLGFVKVNMDGAPIGRKIDLNAYTSYQAFAQALEDMFFGPTTTVNAAGSSLENQEATKISKLLDASSELALTYEDKEGDWMLVGDVPWGMFFSSVRRLRIMRTSETNGLAPRFQERSQTQINKLV